MSVAERDPVALAELRGHRDPHAYYSDILAPLTEPFEERRLAAVATFKKRLAPGIGLAVLASIASWYFLFDWSSTWSLGLMAGAAVAAYVWIHSPVGKYTDNLKQEVYPKIFTYFGDDYGWSESCPWSVSELKDSAIVPSYDRASTEDHVKGSYRAVSVEMVEVLLENESRDKDGKTTYTTVFDGVYFVLCPRKRFSGKTIVTRDYGFIGNKLSGLFKGGGLETVRLEDPEFEKKFEVYSTDQIEARRLLTTSFMQRLLDLCKVMGSRDIACSFFEQKLLITVATSHNYLAPPSAFRPVNFEDDFQKVVKEMQIIFDIIDTLKLDMDIGL